MKTIIALLVMVAVVANAESFQWPWSEDVVEFPWSYAYVSLAFPGLEYVSYVDVYTVTQTAAENLHLHGWTGVGSGYQSMGEMEKVSIVEDSLGYRVRFEWEDDKPWALYMSVQGGEAAMRATHVWPQTGHSYADGEYQFDEISLIVYGGATHLQRNTWASIKSAF